MSDEPERKRVLWNIGKEYEKFFMKVLESGDNEGIRFTLFFYDWFNDFMKEEIDENEKAFVLRSAFAIAKRFLDSKIDGTRLVKIGEIINNLRSFHSNRDALFISEYLKLQIFGDCMLYSEKPDLELLDKYLDHWAEASKEEKVPITYYKRDDKNEIIVDQDRVGEAGPLFFKHCSAECVEWFYSTELKSIDYTPNSLMELDRVIDENRPRELFKDIDIEDEENPYSNILLRVILTTGSYLGEVLVNNLNGKWERGEARGWNVSLGEARLNVFQIAEESFKPV